MVHNWMLSMIPLILFAGFSSASAAPPAKIVSGVITHVVSALFKWLWSPETDAPIATSSRSLIKFEGGYSVETLFDGSKLGIEPYSVELSPSGDLLVLDSENSNLYKISMPLSQYSRPKLIAGSSEGSYGHIDGKPREARMHHPKGHTVDDKGNIYVADTMNMAIRKISHAGVVTIAGGSRGQGLGHVDGPSEGAKFSDDFDLLYIGSSCSLLVIDRGNQAIREIQLHDDDCSHQQDDDLNLGIAVLAAACFFGYMLALLQRRIASMFSSHHDPRDYIKDSPSAAYQKPLKSVRPPLIPAEDGFERQEGLFGSLTKPFRKTFSEFRKKPPQHQLQQQYNQQPNRSNNGWPMQESFMIPNEDEPPPLETRDLTPRTNYPVMTNKMEKARNSKKSRTTYDDWNNAFYQQEQPQQQQQQRQYLQQQQHHFSIPQTCYEQKRETNEIVFGAVQEQDGCREAVVIKAVDYGNPSYSNHNIRSRYNYMGFSYGY